MIIVRAGVDEEPVGTLAVALSAYYCKKISGLLAAIDTLTCSITFPYNYPMQMKIELIILPVTDVDRAKAFYTEKLGFHADFDQQLPA